MRFFCLLGLLSVGVVAAPPHVMVIHSMWPKGKASFAQEYEPPIKQLGWPSKTFRNTEVEALLAALPETDIVVTASVANYEDTVDFGAHRDAWLAYLKRGGVLLVTDASYDSVLSKWVGGFGKGFDLTTKTCVAHEKKTPESRVCTYSRNLLLRTPNDLRPMLARRHNWGHLDSWASAWESLITCADGKSVMVAQRVGRGLVMVTNHFSFRSKSDIATAKALLENLAASRLQAAAGIALTDIAVPDWLPGGGSVRLDVQNLAGEKQGVIATWTVKVGTRTAKEVQRATMGQGGKATLVLSYPDLGRGEVTARLQVVAEPGGEVLDWHLAGEIPPVVAVEIRRPHLAGLQQNLELQMTLTPAARDAAGPFELVVKIDGGEEARMVSEAPVHRWLRGVQDLSDGEHRVQVRALVAGREIGQEEAVFTSRAKARVAFRPDGVMLLDGKPFLPIGFYHVSQSFPPEHRLQMVRDVAAAGFNTVHTRILKLEQYGPFLDECERLGVKVITEFSVSPEKVIPRYRNHPAVLGWNPGDEPAAHGTLPEEMFARYDRFKRLDPDHLAYTVICRPLEYAAYARGTDVLAPDPYPVPRGKVESVYQLLKQAAWEARLQGTAVWAVPQCFGGYSGWTRPPTPAELRAMTYLEMLAGARGFILYTYADGKFQIRDHDVLWRAAGELAGELKALAPFVLNATSTSAKKPAKYYAGTWWRGDVARVVLVNATGEPQSFSCEAASAEVVAGSLPDLRVDKGTARGTLPPLDRVILSVRRKAR